MRKYVRVYREAVPLPWTCHFCGFAITFTGGTAPQAGVVHHLDEDRRNNDLSNLAAAHFSCHARHHTNEAQAWRRLHTPKVRARIQAAKLGKPHIEPKYRCAGCLMTTHAAPMARHQTASGHVGRLPATEVA